MATGIAGDAHAYTTSEHGVPGQIEVPFTQGASVDGYPTITFPGRCVYRSPASRRGQKVRVKARIYENNRLYNRWEFVEEGVWTVTLAPGESSKCLSSYTRSPSVGIGDNAFSVTVVARWRRASSGRRLGKLVVDYDAVGDYQCVTSYGCEIGTFSGSAGMLLGGLQ